MGELRSQVTLFNEHHGMSFHKQNFPDVARQGQLMWPALQMESLLTEPSLCGTEESFSVTGIKASRTRMIVPTFKWGRAQLDGVAYLRIYNMHNRTSVLTEVSAIPRNTGGGVVE